ncbi:DUF2177 family protein [Undibacterium sp.]|jgi:uncharacterized membrane protein|uniref:DUF2177 family protein n=1 Tax=Undibacterium sp. TaxID=1914977 RepID=UPI002CA700AA|nr:DUF2177 family protein [Undibacterium sp.]HTD02451.1 DUF2177 family protein [Undibacterium sp.]
MKKYHIAYFFSALVFCGLDYLWLAYIATQFYKSQLGELLGTPDVAAIALLYLIYIFGIVVFSVRPAMKTGNVAKALILGALLGLVAYGTYDLSNLATIKGWSRQLAIVDMLWGMFATSMAAAAGFLGANWFT